MKKKIALGLAVFLGILILAGCGKQTEETAQNQEKNQAGQQESVGQEEGASENESFKEGSLSASLKELMGMGKSMKCTWTINDGDESGSGVVYVDGEKVREDVVMTGEDGETIVYVISDGNWIYQWSSTSKEGTKMQMNELEKMAEESEETDIPESSDDEGMMEEFDEKVDYNCEKWNADDSLFNPPNDVQFSDMTEMVKNMQQNSQQMMENMCQMCESLPAEAKAECLKNCQ